MLKVGTQSISGLCLGAEEIRKAYLGEALVFESGEGPGPGPSRLPEGYTEVEYIQSNGSQYINTGVNPVYTRNASRTKISMDVEPISAPVSTQRYFIHSLAPADSASGLSACWFAICWATANGAYAKLTTSPNGTTITKSAVTNTTPRRMILELNGVDRTFLEDGISETVTTASLLFGGTNPQSDLMLFGPSGTSSTNKISAKLYSCQIYNGANFPLVRDFVPCIDPSGAVGLYDLVEGTFYANSGTGTFTAGPAV